MKLPRLKKEQLEQIHEERRTQIKNAAIQIFAKNGFTGTKMSMISQAAKISHGLLYHYFRSKDELLVSLIKDAIDVSTTEIYQLIDAPMTPLEKMKTLTDAIINAEGAPVFLLLHNMRNSVDTPEEAKLLLKDYDLNFYIDLLFPLFEEGQSSGEFIAGDAKELIATYITVLSGVMVLGTGYPIPRTELLLPIIQKQK
jgi:AcrR family transcriptional regulator